MAARRAFAGALLSGPLMLALAAGSAWAGPRPAMKDFMGVCGHFFFDGPTYAPVAGRVRNYHSLVWDLDVAKPYHDPPYPFALNRVNWEDLYGNWQRAGFTVDACILMDDVKPEAWLSLEEPAYRFGKAFGSFLGPSGKALVEAVELGNEPGRYSDEQYALMAHGLARGLREGDPALRIVTANLTLGQSHLYAKSIKCYEGWLDEVDVLNVHTYAIVGEWPDRRWTCPEDPAARYLSDVRDLIAWRDAHAPGKEVWVTEFGWDAHRPEGAPTQAGVPLEEGVSTVSRPQQAQFLARSYLIFARMGADRAYMFWYRDEGQDKGLFSACGLISKGVKQPAYFALASLRRNLGDYVFSAVLAEEADGAYAYRFDDAEGRSCVAVWSPTWDGQARSCEVNLEAAGLSGAGLVRAVELAMDEGGDRQVEAAAGSGLLKLQAVGTPRLLFFEGRSSSRGPAPRERP
jgi:hypothetical protein